jgi:hypothetical protein
MACRCDVEHLLCTSPSPALSDLNTPEASAAVATSRITINLSAELHAVLRKLAGEEGRSVSNLCRQLIEAAITQRQRRN